MSTAAGDSSGTQPAMANLRGFMAQGLNLGLRGRAIKVHCWLKSMKRHRLSLLLLLGLGLVPRTALPEDNPPQGNLEAALNSQYHDKIMALRHPLEKETQLYDADGTVLKGGHEGSWTTHG